VRFGLRVIEAAGEANTPNPPGRESGCGGRPKRAPALPASGGLQYRAGRRTHARSRLIEHRHVFRADAAQAGPADTRSWRFLAQFRQGDHDDRRGTFGHGPVMILAAVPAVSTDRHTHMPRSPNTNRACRTSRRRRSAAPPRCRALAVVVFEHCKMRCSSVLGLCISSGW